MRDESTEDVRIVLEPRARTVEPATLMESLFKLTELETRVPVNMNVLVDGVDAARGRRSARRCSNGSTIAATCCCAARATGWRRSSSRLELLAGMIVVFLNLDEVIRIIREDDEPKEALKARFALTDTQANLHPRHAAARLAPARGNGAAQGAGRPRARRRREIEALLATKASSGR